MKVEALVSLVNFLKINSVVEVLVKLSDEVVAKKSKREISFI